MTLAVVLLAAQAAEQRMRDMQQRLETTEDRQNTIVGFLARVAQNPAVLQQMVSVAQSAGLHRISSRNGGERCADGSRGASCDQHHWSKQQLCRSNSASWLNSRGLVLSGQAVCSQCGSRPTAAVAACA